MTDSHSTPLIGQSKSWTGRCSLRKISVRSPICPVTYYSAVLMRCVSCSNQTSCTNSSHSHWSYDGRTLTALSRPETYSAVSSIKIRFYSVPGQLDFYFLDPPQLADRPSRRHTKRTPMTRFHDLWMFRPSLISPLDVSPPRRFAPRQVRKDVNVCPLTPLVTDTLKRSNTLRICNRRTHYDTRKYFFCNRVTNICNSLPIDIVTASILNSFKNRLDKHWLQQDIKYNWESELSGTGSRSYIQDGPN